MNDRGSVVKGTVVEVEPKEAVIQLAGDVTGILKASEISQDRVEDARNVLSVGEEVEVKIISVDRKNRTIGLSIKSKDVDDERAAVREHRRTESERPAPTTLGDLIKAQMEQGKD
jgi:small subunit ribosomal protein S1